MQMRSQCFYSAVMANSKQGYCYSSGILSLSVIKFSFLTVVFLISLPLAIFDQFRFAEAKAYKKTEKIYCSTFWGHHDSIIKRLIKKHARKENLEQHGQLSRIT